MPDRVWGPLLDVALLLVVVMSVSPPSVESKLYEQRLAAAAEQAGVRERAFAEVLVAVGAHSSGEPSVRVTGCDGESCATLAEHDGWVPLSAMIGALESFCASTASANINGVTLELPPELRLVMAADLPLSVVLPAREAIDRGVRCPVLVVGVAR